MKLRHFKLHRDIANPTFQVSESFWTTRVASLRLSKVQVVSRQTHHHDGITSYRNLQVGLDSDGHKPR
eukprot:496264-Rhodomonas_salina.1